MGLNGMAEFFRELRIHRAVQVAGRLFHRFACYLRVKVLICNSQKKRRVLKRQGVFSEAGLQRRLKLFPPPYLLLLRTALPYGWTAEHHTAVVLILKSGGSPSCMSIELHAFSGY